MPVLFALAAVPVLLTALAAARRLPAATGAPSGGGVLEVAQDPP